MATELRLKKFRVQNYKSVTDSGWIEVDEMVTALVGKNEAGKSALLSALYKFNPVDGEEFDGLREFPRSRYSSEFKLQDWDVISVTFDLPTELQTQIDADTALDWNPQTINITKKYSGKRSYWFSPEPLGGVLAGSSVDTWLKQVKQKVARAIDPLHVEDLKELKVAVAGLCDKHAKNIALHPNLNTPLGRALLSEISQEMAVLLTADWQKPILESYMDELDQFVELSQRLPPQERAWEVVKSHIPTFIYFEDYGTLDDTLVIDQFIAEYERNKHDAKLRTKMALFRHVNLDPNEVLRLGQERPGESENEVRAKRDERTINLSSASHAMTGKFQGWWGQRRHEFEYRIDDRYFRVWVKDDKNSDLIELVNRSRGLQWFFSFYLIFLVEADDGHRNAMLLLDEPGLHLHPAAQEDLIEYFDRLARDNQLIYSTHSPFMVDGDHLERVRVVTETASGETSVSDKIWPKDREAVLPLQAALGYHLAQTLFHGRRNLIVEGLTDLWILKHMSGALAASGRIGLHDDVVVTPAGGAKEISHFASLYLANDVEIVTLFDGDSAGKRYAGELQKELFAGSGSRIVFVSDALGNSGIEIEDLIPRLSYLGAVSLSHRNLLGKTNLKLIASEEAKPRVIEALADFASRKGISAPSGSRNVFDKGLTTRALLDEWQKAGPDKLDTTMLDNFEHLFKTINSAFEQSGP
ncbi:MAG: AAA family ATPase [Thermomicrobiales bacterium]